VSPLFAFAFHSPHILYATNAMRYSPQFNAII